MDFSDQRDEIDFDVSKSMRYHAYRRAFWDNIDSLAKFITIASGTSVLVTLVSQHPRSAFWLSIVVTVASAMDVVLGFSKKARDHDGLYRRFSRLAQDIAEEQMPDQPAISRWRRRRIEIEMDEPFIMDLLERRCCSEECIATGRKRHAIWVLKWWQTLFSQFAVWPALHRDAIGNSGG